jgi:anti-sigma-K factor RskA
MLAVPADRLPAALGDLDPGNRALLDLSLRRGVSDAEIGELLRKDPADVARGRDAVLELLCDALDVGGHDRRERVRQAVAALPDDAWRPGVATTPVPPPAPPIPSADEEPDVEEEPEPEPLRPLPPRDPDRAATSRELDDRLYFEPEPRGSRRTAWLLILGGVAVLGVLLALLLSGGDDDDSNESGSQPAPAQNGEAPAPAGDTAKLSPIGGGRGEGTVSVTDEGATITIKGLPNPAPGSYQVWLYNSIVDAKSLGTFPSGSGRLEVSLPSDASKYRFLDVSREPDEANPNHSGVSVMRAPLGDLLRE